MQLFKDLNSLSIVRSLVSSSLGSGTDRLCRNVCTESPLYDA